MLCIAVVKSKTQLARIEKDITSIECNHFTLQFSDNLQCDELVEHGASVGETPAAVVKKCKYTIGMLSDPAAALSVSPRNFTSSKHIVDTWTLISSGMC